MGGTYLRANRELVISISLISAIRKLWYILLNNDIDVGTCKSSIEEFVIAYRKSLNWNRRKGITGQLGGPVMLLAVLVMAVISLPSL